MYPALKGTHLTAQQSHIYSLCTLSYHTREKVPSSESSWLWYIESQTTFLADFFSSSRLPGCATTVEALKASSQGNGLIINHEHSLLHITHQPRRRIAFWLAKNGSDSSQLPTTRVKEPKVCPCTSRCLIFKCGHTTRRWNSTCTCPMPMQTHVIACSCRWLCRHPTPGDRRGEGDEDAGSIERRTGGARRGSTARISNNNTCGVIYLLCPKQETRGTQECSAHGQYRGRNS